MSWKRVLRESWLWVRSWVSCTHFAFAWLASKSQSKIITFTCEISSKSFLPEILSDSDYSFQLQINCTDEKRCVFKEGKSEANTQKKLMKTWCRWLCMLFLIISLGSTKTKKEEYKIMLSFSLVVHIHLLRLEKGITNYTRKVLWWLVRKTRREMHETSLKVMISWQQLECTEEMRRLATKRRLAKKGIQTAYNYARKEQARE